MSLFLRVRRGWYRALRVGPTLLLLAILPSVLYLDHWADYAERALGLGGSIEASELQDGHATHCHLSPGTCSEQPAATLVVQVFPRVVELDHPELPAVLLEDGESVLEQYVRSPLTEPPRL